MSKFTKGKWEYVQAFGVVCSEDTSAVIANVRGAGTGSCFCLTQEEQANARLIATAPEMYKVLQVFADEPSEAEERVDELCTAYYQARELLARIDGEEAEDDAD